MFHKSAEIKTIDHILFKFKCKMAGVASMDGWIWEQGSEPAARGN